MHVRVHMLTILYLCDPGNYIDIFTFIPFGDPKDQFYQYGGIVVVAPYAHAELFPIKRCQFEGRQEGGTGWKRKEKEENGNI